MSNHGDLGGLCVHQISFGLEHDFAACTEPLARAGVGLTAVWHDKLAKIGAARAARILRDSGVAAVSLCPGGILTQRAETEFRAALERNRRMLADAAEIGAATMVTISGGLDEGERDIRFARDRALEGLTRLVPEARAAGVKLALEPLSPVTCATRGVLTTTALTNDWWEAMDAPDVVGIALDSYAIWWDPGIMDQIARAAGRILNLHLADWRRDTRDLRFDRGMPGDGVIDIPGLIGAVRATGFTGPLEFELFSALDWWQRAPDETVAEIVRRYRTLTEPPA